MNPTSPSNSQNYNRFSYVLNNPLKYVDPSGYVAMNPWYEYSDVYNVKHFLFLKDKFEDFNDKNGTHYKLLENFNLSENNISGQFVRKIGENHYILLSSLPNNQGISNQNNANSNSFFSSFSMGAGTLRVEGEGNNSNTTSNVLNYIINPVSNAAIIISGIKYTSSNIFRTGHWIGKNGKHYTMDMMTKGFMFKNSAELAKNSIKWIGRFGNTLGYISTAYNGYQFVINPNWENGIETSVGVGSIFFWEIGVFYYSSKLIYSSSQYNIMENQKRGVDDIFWDLRIMK
ncbi:MAG: hypothetical protein PHU27_07250 [Salinivirgaceae bacterium]|nr:hypothetical protein [Salinivirgaceae bacterium]MDY0144337.1 hypothetical protein [Bacteroidales bacterium]